MPIRPEDRHHYKGPAWEAIRRQILVRAGHACEFCGVQDRSLVPRSGGRIVRIILTIAHLNHVPGDNREVNLRALCQRCHLRWDVEQHRKNASQTRRRRRNNLELPI